MDAKEYFGTELPKRLAADPAAARSVAAVFHMSITGDGGGEWLVDLKSDPPTCKEGGGAADCTITMSNDDFKAIRVNPQAAMQLFFQGKLKVQGNPMLATKLQKIL
ncbi:MAG: SCP2 sterol-binding domain-containing protein [Myxococcota bacterium]|nr:SCP2 sterol-binding domain-containing protein [Myxococcota bacterium]